MKILKRIAQVVFAVVLTTVVVMGVFSSNAASDDPALNYKVQTAANEDPSLKLWFDYSFRKNMTSDTKSTGMNSFSIYMAKNEIESAQFVLYSDTDKAKMTTSVTDFTDGKGHSIDAEVYYEMYVTTSNLNKETAWMSPNLIREGETPDPVFPVNALGLKEASAGQFKLNGGKSQAFLIRAKTTEDTPSGWYSAQLNVYNEQKQQVKTATVYCYVWDFVISEKTELQTAFFTTADITYGGSYKEFYDYLLENRLNAMDLPTGKLSSENEYLLNPRVTAVRMSCDGKGSVKSSYNDTSFSEFNQYKPIYNELATSDIWDEIKDKIYFYTVDEPLPEPLVGTGIERQTVDDVKRNYAAISMNWGDDIRSLVTPCEDHPYPFQGAYTKPVSMYAQEDIKDAEQEMIDTKTVQIFAPRMYAFTPYSELLSYGKTVCDENIDCMRNLNQSIYSGIYNVYPYPGVSAVDWGEMYGDAYDRYISAINMNNAEGTYGAKYELWMYSAGINKAYTYLSHAIENTGLQTKLMFWQAYQYDVTGYLYYGSNNWQEQNPAVYDTTVTGDKTGSWPVNRYRIERAPGEYRYIYGNGVLFYAKNNAKINVERNHGSNVVGSLRAELLRDSVEEYQMLKMLEGYKGESHAKDIVSEVSTNAVRYLSLGSFDRSAWSSSMDDYDIMETVRRQLGNELEAAVHAGQCNHQWNSGTVTKQPGCLTLGEKVYTCTRCNAQKTEELPIMHSYEESFTVLSEIKATCTAGGNRVLQCKTCGYKKKELTKAIHDDTDKLIYTAAGANFHTVTCPVCSKVLNDMENHNSFYRMSAASCTDVRVINNVCKVCNYSEYVSEKEPAGHKYADGKCTVCGEADPNAKPKVVGDLDGDNKVSAKDVVELKSILVGISEQVPEADVNGDTKINAQDVFTIKQIILGLA